MDVRVLPDAEGAAAHAAAWIARRLQAAVRTRGTATLAVSGGRTPEAMFDALSRLRVPWRQVTVTQVDERVAPAGSEARNATGLRRHLLDAIDGDEPSVVLLPVERADRQRAARDASRAVERLGRLDVVHLGVGDDGHTASWPPGDDRIVESPQNVAVVGPFNGTERFTLTPRIVNAARARIVVVVGESKAGSVVRWLLGDTTLPVQRIRRTGTTVVLDIAAAAMLGPLHPDERQLRRQ